MSSRVLRVAVVAAWAALAGAGMFGAITPGFAADDSVRLQVVRLSATANYSVPGDTSPPRLDGYVGYRVTITNVGRKLSGNLVFRGRTLVRDRTEKAVFDSNDIPPSVPVDPQCRTTNPSKTAIACRIGRLAPGASFGPFVVSFKTPIKNVNGIFDGPGQDFVNFRGTLIEAEDRDDFVDRDLRNRVTLAAQSDTQVTTVCPPGGCTAFTGTNGGIPNATDVHTTEVVVPSGDRFTTVSIVETKTGSPAVPCTDNVFECWTSQITTPGNSDPAPVPDLLLTTSSTTATFDPYLTVFLRQDISNIQSSCGAETASFSISSTCYSRVPIESIRVVYVRDGETTENDLAVCGEGDPQSGPSSLPCIFARSEVRDGIEGPVLYYRWELRSKHNGGWGTR